MRWLWSIAPLWFLTQLGLIYLPPALTAGPTDYTQDSACVMAFPFETAVNWLDDQCSSGTAHNLTVNGVNLSHSTSECEANGNGGCAFITPSKNSHLSAPDSDDFSPNAITQIGLMRNTDTADNAIRPWSHHNVNANEGWFSALQDTTDPNKFHRWRMDGVAEDGATTWNELNWQFIGGTWDSAGDNELKNYLNGVLDCSGGCITKASMTNAAVDFRMGENSNGVHDFEGAYDQYIMLSRQLAATEICELSRFGIEGTDTDRGYSCTLPAEIPPLWLFPSLLIAALAIMLGLEYRRRGRDERLAWAPR